MPTATFPARFDNLAKIGKFIEEATKKAGFDDSTTYAVQLAVDEACSNIIEHAYGGESKGDIQCTYHVENSRLIITLRDKGRPFDPEKVQEPNFGAPIEELKPRGAGLFLMRKLMDEIRFEFDQKTGNVLTLVKYIPD